MSADTVFEEKNSEQQQKMLKKKDTRLSKDGKKFSQSEKFLRSVMLNNWRGRLQRETDENLSLQSVKYFQAKSELPVPSKENVAVAQIAQAALLKNSPCHPISEEARKDFISLREEKWIPPINKMVVYEMNKMERTERIPSHLVPVVARIGEQETKKTAIAKAEADAKKLAKEQKKLDSKKEKEAKAAKATKAARVTDKDKEKSQQNSTNPKNPMEVSVESLPLEALKIEGDQTNMMLRRSTRNRGPSKK